MYDSNLLLSHQSIVQTDSPESDWEAEVEAEIAELGPVEKGKKDAGGKKLSEPKGTSKNSPIVRIPSKQSTPGPSTPKQAQAIRPAKPRPKMRPPPASTEDAPQTRSKKTEVIDEFDLRSSRTYVLVSAGLINVI